MMNQKDILFTKRLIDDCNAAEGDHEHQIIPNDEYKALKMHMLDYEHGTDGEPDGIMAAVYSRATDRIIACLRPRLD